MAQATEFVGTLPAGTKMFRHKITGSANASTALTVAGLSGRSLLMVTAVYSGSPTQAGVTTALDSGAGSAYDSTLNTGTANATTTNYLPTVPIPIGRDDAIVITAPSGGGGITASITAYTEER